MVRNDPYYPVLTTNRSPCGLKLFQQYRSVLNPQLWKRTSRDVLDLPRLSHWRTSSSDTLLSLEPVGWKIRRMRWYIAGSDRRTTPGCGRGFEVSFTSGISSTLETPPVTETDPGDVVASEAGGLGSDGALVAGEGVLVPTCSWSDSLIGEFDASKP